MKRFLILGDIMAKTGRRTVATLLPIARQKFSPDIVIANGENAAGGMGLNRKVFEHLTMELGINFLTMGNHWHDKPEIHDVLLNTDRIVVPANMGNVNSEERGMRIVSIGGEKPMRFALFNIIGRVFMPGENRCPFATIDRLLKLVPQDVGIKIIDMHGEATSEKQAIGQYLNQRVSIVYGTHSHVPTGDVRILGGHTGFITDIGMTGAYDSVIGLKKEFSIKRLTLGVKTGFEPSVEDPWMTFLVGDVDEVTGKCVALTHQIWKLKDFSQKAHMSIPQSIPTNVSGLEATQL